VDGSWTLLHRVTGGLSPTQTPGELVAVVNLQAAPTVHVPRAGGLPSARVRLEGARVYSCLAIALFLLHSITPGSRLATNSLQGGYLVVYGMKTVTPTLTREEALKRHLQYGHVPQVNVTRLFSLDPSTGTTAVVFSDESLPVRVLNSEGGGATALHGVVATTPVQRTAIALMGTRGPGPGDEFRPTPSLYELSLDGRNAVRRIADVEGAITTFALSRDGSQVAYLVYRPIRLVIRRTDSGRVAEEVHLEGPEPGGMYALDWSPDGTSVLVRWWLGPEYENEYKLVHVPEGRVEPSKIRGSIYSLYSFFPKRHRLLGVRRPSSRFLSIAVDGGGATSLPLIPCSTSFEAEISPDETLIAYPCDRFVVGIGALAPDTAHNRETTVRVGHPEGNFLTDWVDVGPAAVLGWIVR